jgi:hypothetical protein
MSETAISTPNHETKLEGSSIFMSHELILELRPNKKMHYLVFFEKRTINGVFSHNLSDDVKIVVAYPIFEYWDSCDTHNKMQIHLLMTDGYYYRTRIVVGNSANDANTDGEISDNEITDDDQLSNYDTSDNDESDDENLNNNENPEDNTTTSNDTDSQSVFTISDNKFRNNYDRIKSLISGICPEYISPYDTITSSWLPGKDLERLVGGVQYITRNSDILCIFFNNGKVSALNHTGNFEEDDMPTAPVRYFGKIRHICLSTFAEYSVNDKGMPIYLLDDDTIIPADGVDPDSFRMLVNNDMTDAFIYQRYGQHVIAWVGSERYHGNTINLEPNYFVRENVIGPDIKILTKNMITVFYSPNKIFVSGIPNSEIFSFELSSNIDHIHSFMYIVDKHASGLIFLVDADKSVPILSTHRSRISSTIVYGILNIRIFNIRHFAPHFSLHPSNLYAASEAYCQIDPEKEKNCLYFQRNSFDYQDGNQIMRKYFDSQPPQVIDQLVEGEAVYFGSMTAIVDRNGHVVVLNEEGKRILLEDVSEKDCQVETPVVHEEINSEYLDKEFIKINIDVEESPFQVIKLLAHEYMYPNIKYDVVISLFDGNRMISGGSGITNQYLENGYREYRQRYFMEGRFVHFNKIISTMKKHKLYNLGRMMKYCNLKQGLGKIPIRLILCLMRNMKDSDYQFSNEELEYLAQLHDAKGYENLVKHADDIISTGFGSYREALEHFCELDQDSNLMDQIQMIANGFLSDDNSKDKYSVKYIWETFIKEIQEPDRYFMKLEIEGAGEREEQIRKMIMEMEEEDFRSLLVNWSGSSRLTTGNYTIKIGEELSYATCFKTINIPKEFLSDSLDDLKRELTGSYRYYNGD